ncbi:MAG: shikimate kinase [Clostridiaceae bacterium]|nr:shikimate kinase [Clostridiaceae bacterium]
MEYGLIGEKLGHSFSREIHQRLGGYDYLLQELTPAQLPAFLEKRDFRGINVTIPYKQTVIPLLDEVDPKAAAIGAVNTIVNRRGRLCGYNTDYDGMAALARHAGLTLKNKNVLILGTGGTSHTAMTVAADLGAAEIRRVSRTGRGDAITYEQAADLPVQVLINTTPCGMYPGCDGQPMDLSRFGWLEGVLDAVYNPLRTRLVLQARDNGARGQGGLYMLVAQAAAACRLFLDRPLPDGALDSVYRAIHGQKQNIVLTGMPGSGKSTVGRVLARQLGRELVDTDTEIIRLAKKPIPEIFAQRGERGFRDLESQVIQEVSRRTGLVIATGGGAILREENVRRLRQNGRIYFLDRPAEDILPTDDRPLARDMEAVRQRYAERYPRYTSTADAAVPVRGSAEDVAAAIREEFLI